MALTIRRARLSLLYEGIPADEQIGVIERFQYKDEAEGKSDSISLTIDNIDRRWANGWVPRPYDRIAPTIFYQDGSGNELGFPCGSFYADDFEIVGGPLTAKIGAVSAPVQYGFSNTQTSKTWQDVTVQQIADEISEKYDLGLQFEADDSDAIEAIEQARETDSAFLKKVCNEYGYKLKIYSNRLIIYRIDDYEDRDTVVTLTPEIVVSGWQWTTSAQGTYTGATLSYSKGDGEDDISVTVGGGDRILSLNRSCDSEAEAIKAACDAVNDKNRALTTVSMTLKEPLFLSSTQTVMLSGFGAAIDGKHFIKTVSMSLGGNGGLTVGLQMYRIQDRITA